MKFSCQKFFSNKQSMEIMVHSKN